MTEVEKINNIDDAITWFEDELIDGPCSPTYVQCIANTYALNALKLLKTRIEEEGGEACKLYYVI